MEHTPETPKKLLTVNEAAERLSVTTGDVYRLIESRKLEHIRIGRAIRIHPDALDAYRKGH